ncbi:MAG: YeeE/YedE family protein [Bosea sp.]|uniref:YeeE/YedE family protein n=1 Tax=Bosea sp. (in: a-proteobacteria) TaxID=1871050 RepID=UPI001AD2698B|nr:YeeE/YedE family protein [Bosea sp. (in: a-proteobacteria)]MBN9468719.1 YeeE/YedE family protein [Bosea sp. (in: a-proteobacteria)]
MNRFAQVITALAAGTVFGLGLAMSGMLDPARVRGFLDLFGAWDPSLAFVLGGAVMVALVGMAVLKRLRRPVFDEQFHLPATSPVDRRLVLGSAIFGVGWGMAGFCPGPALASLSLGLAPVALFVVAMLAGMTLHDRVWSRRMG